MAKMFYTLEEAAKKLGKSPEQVREMAQSGQLQEFRDRDKLVFKREQVDLLSGDDEASTIPLADSGEIPLAMEDSKGGSAASVSGGTVGSTKERSGISIFEPEDGEEVDPSAQTQVTPSVGGLGGDAGASGSGLMGLTQEADDTSLGANLLDDAYAGGGGGGGGDTGAGGALFEPAGVASDVSAVAGGGMMVMAEPYDGPGSGLVGGLAFGMVAILATLCVCVIYGLLGGGGLITVFAENVWMWVGIMAGIPVIGGVVGWLVCRNG